MSGQDVYVNGQWDTGQGEGFTSTCPATGETVWQGRAAGPAQVNSAVAAARAAFPAWSRLPQSERTRIIEAYGEALAERKAEIAETISRDMGKALWDATGEAGAMIGKIALSISAQAERAGGTMKEAPFGRIHLTHRAHGVMAVFGPFNFPGHLP
ncbi:MAG: aldehyde dehydrogenase family protein, partial [Pseudomonadota bacterium]